MSKDIVKKFQKALDKFAAMHRKNPNVIGILLSGSFIHSTPDKNSDLDILVILKDSKTRTRGNTWIDGIEIEYFINPIHQIENYLATEVGGKAPCTAHMFANSVVLYRKGDEINRLIKEAKKIIKKKAPKMSKSAIETERYHIDDLEKDLEDTYLRDDAFAFNVVATDVLENSLSTFFKVNRTTKEKSKRLQLQMKSIDPKFERVYTKALLEKNMARKFKLLTAVIRYIENMLGGKRPKEWKLTGPCTVQK